MDLCVLGSSWLFCRTSNSGFKNEIRTVLLLQKNVYGFQFWVWFSRKKSSGYGFSRPGSW
jgi:hypothetical protein